jgi:hypothetical protein
MLTRVAFGIPTIVALVAAGILLLRDSRMTMTTVEAVVPVDTSANLSSKRPYLDLTPTNLDSFLDEFALAYFGHPNSFAPMFIEAAPPTELFRSHNERPFEHARHRWKMTLQNVSTRNSTFVSSAEFRMRLMKDQPFPWHRLNVTPHLDVTLSMVPMYRPLASMGGPIVCEVAEAPRLALLRIPMITLRSDGVAPAFEVRVRGRTQTDAPAAPIVGKRVEARLSYASLGVKPGQVIRIQARQQPQLAAA